MKTIRSTTAALLSLLVLAGCGAEQFGTTPQSSSESVSGLKSFEQLSCSTYTLIKPKVDILYVVDNSTSSYYVASDIKTAITNTVNSISKEFDYRVIGTGLLPVGDDTNYQILTNSQDPLPNSINRIMSPTELSFFTPEQPGGANEAGLRRTADFINGHPGIFRQGAYHLTVLISNGRDSEVEILSPYGNGETTKNLTAYKERVDAFKQIKANFQSQDFRFFTVTAQSNCKTGYQSSLKSYVDMSKEFGAADNRDLCVGSSISSIFTNVNNSIKQVLVPHTYRYWPITFAENNETVSLSEIQVYKVSGNNAPTILDSSAWTYYNNTTGAPLNTRELPTPGEPVSGRHFIRFNDSSRLTYPDCVQVRSVSRTEYYGYVVIPQEPKPETLVLRINGQIIPRSSTNGWSYVGNVTKANIKMPYPNAGDELPAVSKSGFMIQLNGTNNYYKSGDNVNADYIPAGI